MQVDKLLNLMVDKRASDLYLVVPSRPLLCIDRRLVQQEDLPPVTARDLEMVLEQITTLEQRSILSREMALDLVINVPGLARVRVGVLRQRGTLTLAFRLVPFEVLSTSQLELLLNGRGLILVTGPSSSGKSTILAGMTINVN